MAKVNKKLIDAVDFSYIVEKVYTDGEYELLSSAVIALADDYNIPEDKIKKCLTPNLIKKLQEEAEELGYIRKTSSALFEF